MKRLSTAVSAALLALVTTAPALAAGPLADITRMDIIGLKLGATPADAREALKFAGFTITSEFPEQSFQEVVEEQIARRDGRRYSKAQSSVRTIEASRGGHEKMYVRFLQEASGPRAEAIRLTLGKPDDVDLPYVKAEAIRKFGEPTTTSGDLGWCTGLEFSGCSTRLDRAELRTSDLIVLLLEQGSAYRASNYEQAIKDEVNRRSPKSRPSL